MNIQAVFLGISDFHIKLVPHLLNHRFQFLLNQWNNLILKIILLHLSNDIQLFNADWQPQSFKQSYCLVCFIKFIHN